MAPPASPAGSSGARRLRLATRGSPLARVQTDAVADALRRAVPGLVVEAVVVSTRGDRQADVALSLIGGQGAFVKEVQAAVLDGAADAAVHSAKDLPPVPPEDLVVAAVPPRADPRDVLVGAGLDDLGPGATVATGSARRRAQLANLRPDLTFVELRGNMATRLGAVGGKAAAVVAAAAALARLGVERPDVEVLPPSVCLPQVGQGALAVEARAGDAEVLAWLAAVDHRASHDALNAERALLAALGADCSVPVAGWARLADGGAGLVLEGLLATGDGRVVVRTRRTGTEPATLGAEVAAALFDECGASSVAGWDPS